MPSSELCCLGSTKLIKTLTFIFQIIAPMEFVVNAGDTLTIPTKDIGVYNATINWGDG